MAFGKGIVDAYRKTVARKSVTERTHTGYLVFVNVKWIILYITIY